MQLITSVSLYFFALIVIIINLFLLAVTEEILSMIHSLFPLHSIGALDLLDHKSVTLVSSPSHRKIYTCIGSSGCPYLISYTGYSCTCPSWQRSVSLEDPWCKHLIAVQLWLIKNLICYTFLLNNFLFNHHTV